MKIFYYLLACGLFFGSCNTINSKRIRGNGQIITQNLALTGFNSIDIGDAANIYLTQDSAYSVIIKTDENLLPYIVAQIEDGELDIDQKNGVNLRPSDQIDIYISMPTIQKISVSGASTLKGQNRIVQNGELSLDLSGASDGSLELRAPSVKLDVSGASTLNLSGETRDIKGQISGASTLKAFELKSENTNIDASGASTGQVFASVSLTAGASGASSIRYKGDAKTSISANGAGSVKKAD